MAAAALLSLCSYSLLIVVALLLLTNNGGGPVVVTGTAVGVPRSTMCAFTCWEEKVYSETFHCHFRAPGKPNVRRVPANFMVQPQMDYCDNSGIKDVHPAITSWINPRHLPFLFPSTRNVLLLNLTSHDEKVRIIQHDFKGFGSITELIVSQTLIAG